MASNPSPICAPCPYVNYSLWCTSHDCENCPNYIRVDFDEDIQLPDSEFTNKGEEDGEGEAST